MADAFVHLDKFIAVTHSNGNWFLYKKSNFREDKQCVGLIQWAEFYAHNEVLQVPRC